MEGLIRRLGGNNYFSFSVSIPSRHWKKCPERILCEPFKHWLGNEDILKMINCIKRLFLCVL